MPLESWETQELGSELLIYNKETGDVHVLNSTAALIWKAAQTGKNEEEIFITLREEFSDVPDEQLREDLRHNLQELRTLSLLENPEK